MDLFMIFYGCLHSPIMHILPPDKGYKIISEQVFWVVPSFPEWFLFSYHIVMGQRERHCDFLSYTSNGVLMYQLGLKVMDNIN